MVNATDVAVHPAQAEVRKLLRNYHEIEGIVSQLEANGLTPQLVAGSKRDLVAALLALSRYAKTGDAREREVAELHLQAAVSF